MRRKIKDPYLPGEELYKYYFSMGAGASIQRLAKWAIANGKAKPVPPAYQNKQGLPAMGVWKAMWRWASMKNNKTDAYLVFKDYVKNYGWLDDTDFPWEIGTEISWQDWCNFMLRKIKTAWQYPPGRYARFLRENGWT